MKVFFRDAIIASQMPFWLVPEVLDSVNVISVLSKQFGVVDADMFKLGYVQHIIGPERISVDDRMGPYLFSYNGHKRC